MCGKKPVETIRIGEMVVLYLDTEAEIIYVHHELD
jgi:hypothetical protein